MGGALFFMFLIPIFTISTFFPVLQNWFLGFWSSQYELHDTKDIPVKKLASFNSWLFIKANCFLDTSLSTGRFYLSTLRYNVPDKSFSFLEPCEPRVQFMRD
jgi:hypothetical protein